MGTLKKVIRLTFLSPVLLFANATFWILKCIPNTGFVQRSIQILSAATRRIPENRTKPIFIDRSLLLNRRHFDFVFKSSRLGISWTACAFPDLLTRHMMFEGMYQQDVLVALRSVIKTGDVVFDVGGHHGLMAIVSSLATGATGRVVTFEPNPYARRYLETHLALNNVRNVAVESVALSDKNDVVSFYIQTGDVSWNSTIIEKFAGHDSFSESISVRTVTLDDYIAQSNVVPDVIKIDVEGSEFLILNGARTLFREHKPVLIMEFNPLSASAAGRTISNYVEFFREHSYKLLVLKGDFLGNYKFSAREDFDEAKHTRNNRLVNVICLPQSGRIEGSSGGGR